MRKNSLGYFRQCSERRANLLDYLSKPAFTQLFHVGKIKAKQQSPELNYLLSSCKMRLQSLMQIAQTKRMA